MRRNFLYLLASAAVLSLASCTTTKFVPDGSYLLAEGPKLVGDLLGHFPCRFLAATPSLLFPDRYLHDFQQTLHSPRQNTLFPSSIPPKTRLHVRVCFPLIFSLYAVSLHIAPYSTRCHYQTDLTCYLLYLEKRIEYLRQILLRDSFPTIFHRNHNTASFLH